MSPLVSLSDTSTEVEGVGVTFPPSEGDGCGRSCAPAGSVARSLPPTFPPDGSSTDSFGPTVPPDSPGESDSAGACVSTRSGPPDNEVVVTRPVHRTDTAILVAVEIINQLAKDNNGPPKVELIHHTVRVYMRKGHQNPRAHF